jgi:indolepyruvate ferredoxin oxidoreductase alpha subunit
MVVVSADDPSMHSSQNEQDNRHYARLAKVPMLEPSDSQEAKDFVGIALDISEQFDTPVLLRTTTRISHSKTVVELKDRREKPEPAEFERAPQKFVMIPGHARLRHIEVEERLKKLEEYANNAEINRIEWGDAKIGVITSGISYQYVKEAMPEASVLKLGLTYPLAKDLIRSFAEKVDTLFVVEELDPFLEEQIKAMGIKVTGKDKLPLIYEFDQGVIRERLLGEKRKEDNILSDVSLPPRPPVLCPGCPHRGVFYVLKKLKLVVTGDIGCYTLGVVPPLSAMDTTVCMGASVGMAFGVELALKDKVKHKVVGVIGDSTFVHSGITGLIDIVYNKGASTVIILDNRITGMTGHQDNPATGKTLMGEHTHQLDLGEVARAVGVKSVRVIDPYDLGETERVIREEIAKDEPSVIITNRPCVLIVKDKEWDKYQVDQELCRSCGMCYKVGCSAIYKENGKAKIDILFCTGCGICGQVCRFNAIKKVGEEE